MSLQTFPLVLTTSDQDLVTVPSDKECVVNNFWVTGTGNLTLKFYKAQTGNTHTVFDNVSMSNSRIEGSFNLDSGDKLIASGTNSISLFVSTYFVNSK